MKAMVPWEEGQEKTFSGRNVICLLQSGYRQIGRMEQMETQINTRTPHAVIFSSACVSNTPGELPTIYVQIHLLQVEQK